MTILGDHTVHELSELRDALTAQLGDLQTAYQTGAGAWAANNPQAFGSWIARYDAAMPAWGAALDQAELTLDLTPQALWDLEVAEQDYQGLAAAFAPFEALDGFLRVPANGFPQADLPNYSNTPQPTAPDADLAVGKAVNKLLAKLPFSGTPWAWPAIAIAAAVAVVTGAAAVTIKSVKDIVT